MICLSVYRSIVLLFFILSFFLSIIYLSFYHSIALCHSIFSYLLLVYRTARQNLCCADFQNNENLACVILVNNILKIPKLGMRLQIIMAHLAWFLCWFSTWSRVQLRGKLWVTWGTKLHLDLFPPLPWQHSPACFASTCLWYTALF